MLQLGAQKYKDLIVASKQINKKLESLVQSYFLIRWYPNHLRLLLKN